MGYRGAVSGHRIAPVLTLAFSLSLAATACKSGDGPTTDPATSDGDKTPDAGEDANTPAEQPSEASGPSEEQMAAAEEVFPEAAESAGNECKQSCQDEGKEFTDLATCRLNCMTEKGHTTESSGVAAARSYMLCADSCPHGAEVDTANDPCRDECRTATLDAHYPADNAEPRECASSCFDAGFVCGQTCIEYGSKTDDDDPCIRVCIADARSCFDGCAG